MLELHWRELAIRFLCVWVSFWCCTTSYEYIVRAKSVYDSYGRIIFIVRAKSVYDSYGRIIFRRFFNYIFMFCILIS
jgi:hypothetical protein